MRTFTSVGLALAVAWPLGAHADDHSTAVTSTPASVGIPQGRPAGAATRADIQALRQEIESLRAAYEARLNALEQRLNEAQARQEAAVSPTPAAAAAPAVAAAPEAGSAVDAAAGAGGGANAFNPALALILSGLYTQTSKDPAQYRITGVQLPPGASVGPGTRGFSLAETELDAAANIDPWWSGAANIALEPDDTVSIEEAYVQTTSLGHGLTAKAGRFFSGIGYLNSQHSHTWDFVDNPLAYQAFLGTQYADDGVQLHWLLPMDQYLELGVELGRGRSFPGSGVNANGAGMAAFTAHTGGDVGDSNSWRAGVSVLNAKASGQLLRAVDASGNAVTNAFDGTSRVWVVDGVWKWAPNGNATQTNFKLQGEYLHSRRDGTLSYDVGGVDTPGLYSAAQSGWYLQGIYQFMPHWRVGVRTERLDTGHPNFGINDLVLGQPAYAPTKNSLMVDFSPSEFSRIRLQYARDKARQGSTDDEVQLQYQMSLGAHGAHSF